MSSPTVEISKEFVLPVVVVGKDRTRMTCAVIDHLKAHIKNATPYFICVSDRSRPGHDKVVENHLRSMGEERFEVLRTIPEENRYGWGCAINLGLQCAFDVCKESSFALVVDNDWLLQRDLDIDKYSSAFACATIGAVTFKSVNPVTNVKITEETIADGNTYFFRSPAENGKYSYAAEIGCMLITCQMCREYGQFKENCKTDETEWDFCNWYNSLTCEDKNDKHLWFANDRDMYHTELNGEGHVFTHVGLHSQHAGPHRWEVPEKYLYLSDEEADAKLCHDSYWIQAPDSQEVGSCEIEWSRYFDRVYCMHHLPQRNKWDRLWDELKRVGLADNPIFEIRYTSPCKYDKMIWEREKDENICLEVSFVNIVLELRRILYEARYFGYKRILLLENDVAFLKDLSECARILDMTPKGFDLVQYDKFVNDGCIQQYEKCVKEKVLNDCFADARESIFTSAACYALSAEGIEKMLHLLDERIVAPDRAFDIIPLKRAVAIKNLAIQVFTEGSWSVRFDGVNYMHKVYANAGVDYAEYNVPEGYKRGSLFGRDACPHKRQKGRKYVSVYAIARNEAPVAERWYACAREADEVCVLVNNSTDDTAEILRRLGAKVTVKDYDDWSFAVARNDSMSLVSPEADILFTLDLDETIAPGWRKSLEDAWIEREKSGMSPTGCVYKYIWSFMPDGTEAQSFSVRKIHANGTGKWKYRCHELLTEVDDSRVFFLDGFVVEHHQNRKTNRSNYLPLLEKDAKEMPDDDRSAYYYARELMYLGRWQESLDEFKRHLSLPSARWAAERASSMRNIASCYGQLGNKELCELWLRKSADEDPTNREATFRLGEIAMEEKDYPAAVAAFRRCLAIEKPSLEYISAPIVWSARPWFLYAQALWWTGDWKDAEEATRKALEIEPNNPEVAAQLRGMSATRKKFRR